jgi:hypothetical protein
MHVVSFVKGKDKGEFDDYTLYSGKEKNPHMITHLIKREGYTLAGGAVKNLFQHQWIMNHTAKQIKDQLDLTSKIIFQTSDGNFIGQNVLTAIEQGQLLIHKINEPLTMLSNKADTVAIQNFQTTWKALGNEINGISESMLGLNPPSGTAWGLEQAKLAESHSLFELMTENKGLYIEEMLRRFVIPFIKKQMDTSEEISAILESHQITQLDAMYVPNEVIKRVNKKKTDTVLSGQVYSPEMEVMDSLTETQNVQKELSSMGNQRFIKPSDITTKTWKEVLKDLEWEIEIDITGESKDSKLVMTTLNTALQVMMNPMFAQNKKAQLVVDRILEEAGTLSPIELSQVPNPVAQPMQPTTPAGVGGGAPNQITQ